MISNSKRFWSELLPITILSLSVLFFFSEIVFSGSTLFGQDFVLAFYPWKKFLYEYVQSENALPFWNPHVLAGTPFIANIQASMFYPLGFFFYVMPTEYAYGYTVILHCLLGTVFMYSLARTMSLSKTGSLLAAMVFTYNGFFMGHLYAGHLTFVQNYIWIPLIFLWLVKFFNSLYLRYAVLSGLFLGIQILGGFPQVAFYTILALALAGAYHVGERVRLGEKRAIPRLSVGIAIIVFLGFGVAAIQIFPSYEFAQLSNRSGGVAYEFATIDSFDPLNFITFLIPNFFGNPVNNSYWKSPAVWQFWELGAYAGIGPLLLLGFIGRHAKSYHIGRFLILLLLLSLFLSLGRFNPLYRLIYHLPGFGHFRIPAQILYLYVFSLSLLSGMGLDGISKSESYSRSYKAILGCGVLFLVVLIGMLLLRSSWLFSQIFELIRRPEFSPDLMARLHEIVKIPLFTGLGLLFLFAGLIHWKHRIRSNFVTIAFLLVATVDLWTFSKPLVRTTDLSLTQEKLNRLMFLKSDPGIYRVVTAGSLFNPNDGLVYGFHDIQGYDPLLLRRYVEYINKAQNLQMPPERAVVVRYAGRLDNNLIRLLNVRYSVSDKAKCVKSGPYLPHAFLVHRSVIVPQAKVLTYMASRDFDPTETVVFEPQYRQFLHRTQTREDFKGYCSIRNYGGEEMQIETSANHACYLVLSEIFYPGWEAAVDGKKVPILPGNYVFRVVPLEPGKHRVNIRFVAWPFRIGAVVTVLTLACSLGLLLWTKNGT